jgi:heme oxygenase
LLREVRLVVRTTDIGARLRNDTAVLHSETEAVLGLPGSVRTLDEYRVLLGRFLVFHTGIECALASERWRENWTGIGIVLGDHSRTHLLATDLAELGASDSDSDSAASPPEFADFGEALGALYVTEGSSLGGRLLAPAFAAVLGAIPTRFFLGEGRGHPLPWRSLQAGLVRYESGGGDYAAVLTGASATFRAFGSSFSAADSRNTESRNTDWSETAA